MKLSDAILKGSEQREMCRHRMFFYQGEMVRSCALGAAYEGVFGLPSGDRDEAAYENELIDVFPELIDSRYDQNGQALITQITRRNDLQEQTREFIAAWLKEQDL